MNIRCNRLRANIIFSAWILFTGWAVWTPAPAVAEELLFGVDQFPPYQYLTEESETLGSSYEVVRAVYNKLHIPIKIEFLPWKRALLNSKKGDSTGVFSCGYKKERESYLHYSEPINYATKGVMVKKNHPGPQIISIKDLKNLSIGAVAGFAANKLLTEAGIPFYDVPNLGNVIPMLSKGRFDVLYITLETGQFLAAEAGKAEAFEYLRLMDIPLRPYHLCFSKKWPGYLKLVENFNRALGELEASGRLNAIIKSTP